MKTRPFLLRPKEFIDLMGASQTEFWTKTAAAAYAEAVDWGKKKKRKANEVRDRARRRLSSTMLEFHLTHNPLSKKSIPATIYLAILNQAIVRVNWERIAHRLLKTIEGYRPK